MFEKTVIRRAENGPEMTLGQIAQAMMFYGRVHLVLDQGTLSTIVKAGGYNDLMMLLGHENVSAVYVEDILGTHTENHGGREVHGFVSMMLAGRDAQPNLGNKKSRLINTFERLGFDKKSAAVKADRFRASVAVKRFSDFVEGASGITSIATEDVFDARYIKAAIKEILEQNSWGNPDDLQFEISSTAKSRFEVRTNLPKSTAFTVAGLLTKILAARGDLTIAAFYGGDFETSSDVSSLIRLRTKDILRRSDLDRSAISDFKELTLPDSASIAEVIDSKQRTVPEFIKLMNDARRFHAWIKGSPPDADLAREYLRAVTSEAWISRFPARGIRFMMGLGIGAASPVAGAAASLADTFLLDRMLGGWRPNHFVDRKLRRFMSED